MLKAELHIHTHEDPQDSFFIKHTAKQLIDEAHKQNFDILAFTCHNHVLYFEELQNYAKTKNIFLIPGVERTIHGKHVLIYNLTNQEAQNIKSFKDLHQLKQQKQKSNQPFLVVAPHPFYPLPTCLRNLILKYFHLFDAWEYSFFYHQLINPNKKTQKLAQKYHKPLIGNSDIHRLSVLGKTYTLINSEKNLHSIFHAIRNNQVEIKTAPLSLPLLFKLSCLRYYYGLKKAIS